MTYGYSPLQGYVAGESKRLEGKDFTEPGQDVGDDHFAHSAGKTCKSCGRAIAAGQPAAAAAKPVGYTTSALLRTRPAYAASRSTHEPCALRAGRCATLAKQQASREVGENVSAQFTGT
jgi:hypothetical protein